MTLVIIVLASLVLSLMVIRWRQNKQTTNESASPQSFAQNIPQYRYEQQQPKYLNVLSAPDLSMFENKRK